MRCYYRSDSISFSFCRLSTSFRSDGPMSLGNRLIADRLFVSVAHKRGLAVQVYS